jgi:hypothetical protein
MHKVLRLQGGTIMLTHNLGWLYQQLQDSQKNHRPYNELLLQELNVLDNDLMIKTRISQLYEEKRLPPVTGPKPRNCASCGQPLP